MIAKPFTTACLDSSGRTVARKSEITYKDKSAYGPIISWECISSQTACIKATTLDTTMFINFNKQLFHDSLNITPVTQVTLCTEFPTFCQANYMLAAYQCSYYKRRLQICIAASSCNRDIDKRLAYIWSGNARLLKHLINRKALVTTHH